MKLLNYVACSLLFSGLSLQVFAQDETDALRYSYLSPMGTARSIGFGNALGSIGGDFSSLSVNPAGIGIYRRSEFTFTPSLKINSTQSTYLGTASNDNNVRFNVNNIAMVFTNAAEGQRYDRSDWKAVSFGIGMTRLADYNRDYNYIGKNSGVNSSSYSELFALNADDPNTDLNSFNNPGGRAYNAYLIDYDSASNSYLTRVPYKAGITQSRSVRERGGTNEVVLSFGGNYQEKLMLGATLGIPIIYYKRDAEVTETADVATTGFSSYTYNEALTTRGTGVNLKLGAIYKPNDYVRLGLAIHTPTYYSMHDDYQYTLNNAGYTGVQSDPGTYDYSMITPWRAILSVAVIAGKQGFITADYEAVNYSSARFYLQDSRDYQKTINNAVTNTYKASSIFRLGGELKLTNFFMVRAGFGYYTSPYQSTFDNNNRIDISGGVGFRFGDMFIDLALQHTQYTNPEQFYALYYAGIDPIIQTASIKNSLNNAAITIGFKL